MTLAKQLGVCCLIALSVPVSSLLPSGGLLIHRFNVNNDIIGITGTATSLRHENDKNKSNQQKPRRMVHNQHRRQTILFANLSDEEKNQNSLRNTNDNNDSTSLLQNPLLLVSIAFLYWYLLVFGAAAASNGLPVPTFLPMVPGWPPSDQDLVPVIEDSIHFFYISDLLSAFSDSSSMMPEQQLPQLRLAFFNSAEAWVFSFLPLLLKDRNRLPLPVVLGTWFGALGLTNAFLAPYLAFRQFFIQSSGSGSSNDGGFDTASAAGDDDGNGKSIDSKLLNVGMGIIASSVVGYALIQTILTTATAPGEWLDFVNLVKTDRTYLAFAVDLVLFTCFQSLLVEELKSQDQGSDNDDERINAKIPFVGLMALLFK